MEEIGIYTILARLHDDHTSRHWSVGNWDLWLSWQSDNLGLGPGVAWVRSLHAATVGDLEVWQWTFGSRPVWLVNKSAGQPQFNLALIQQSCRIHNQSMIAEYAELEYDLAVHVNRIPSTNKQAHIRSASPRR